MFYSHSGTDKKRSMADLAEFPVNDEVIQETRRNSMSSNNMVKLLLDIIVFLLRFGEPGNVSLF